MIFFACCTLLGANLSAGPTQADSAAAGSPIGSDIETAWCDAGKFFAAPLSFNQHDWIVAGSVVAGTALLFSADERIRSVAQRNHSSTADDVFEVGREYGRAVYGLSLAGGCYLGGLALRNGELRKTGVMIVESIAFAGITTVALKVVAGRNRPYTEHGVLDFDGISFRDEANSLPSGHSAVAFAVSSISPNAYTTFLPLSDCIRSPLSPRHPASTMTNTGSRTPFWVRVSEPLREWLSRGFRNDSDQSMSFSVIPFAGGTGVRLQISR